MTPIEIVFSIFLLIFVPTVGIRITNRLYSKYGISAKQKEQILMDIEVAIQQGISILKNTNYTESELKKIRQTRDKFLIKTSELIRLIADYISYPITHEVLVDKLLFDSVKISKIDNNLIKNEICFNDYIVIYSMVKSLICDSIFPKKEDYIKLNELHKKYISRNKNGKK